MKRKQEQINRHLNPEKPISALDSRELEHLLSCRFCQRQMIEQTEEHEMVRAPETMKSEILSKLNRPDVRLIAASNRLSKKTELFFFSLRVGIGVLCSLTLLAIVPPYGKVSGELGKMENEKTLYRKDLGTYAWEASNRFTEQLNQLLNLEVYKYDKKKR